MVSIVPISLHAAVGSHISIIEKAEFVDDATVGGKVKYSFIIKNLSFEPIRSIRVIDDNVDNLSCPADELEAQETMMCTAEYTITKDDVIAGFIKNSAKVNVKSDGEVGFGDQSDTGTDEKGIDIENSESIETPQDENGATDGDPTNDPTILRIDNHSAIDIKKTGLLDDGGDGVQAGDSITYTLDVTNTGKLDLNDVQISDTKIRPNNYLIGSLATGETKTLKVDYNLTQADVDAGSILNLATAIGVDSKDRKVTNTDTVEIFTKTDDIKIKLEKSGVLDKGTDGVFNKGDTVLYTFKITNTGSVTLKNIVLTDNRISPFSPSCTSSLSEVKVDAEVTCTATYNATQDDVDAGKIYNMATVRGEDPYGTIATDTDDSNISENAISTIQITKASKLNISGSRVAKGDTIDYTFTVTNTGAVTLHNVIVTDPLVTVNGEAITLAPKTSDSQTFTATYIITQDDINTGIVNNMAHAIGEDKYGKKTEANSTSINPWDAEKCKDKSYCSTTTPFEVYGEIELQKSAKVIMTGDKIETGDIITYTLVVTNVGNVSLFEVEINDPRIKLEGLDAGDLDAGEQKRFDVNYTLTQDDLDDGEVNNTAMVTSMDSDDNKVEDNSTDPTDSRCKNQPECHTYTDLNTVGKIDLIKTGVYEDSNVDNMVNVSDNILYTFKITNIGNVMLYDIDILDSMVESLEGEPIESLAPGKTIIMTGKHKLTQAEIDKGMAINTAIVKGEDPDGREVNDTSDSGNENDKNKTGPDVPTTTLLNPVAYVHGVAFVDTDQDGKLNEGEQVLENITVTITDKDGKTHSVKTDENGTYRVEVPYGTSQVDFVSSSFPNNIDKSTVPKATNITLSKEEPVRVVDAPVQQPGLKLGEFSKAAPAGQIVTIEDILDVKDINKSTARLLAPDGTNGTLSDDGKTLTIPGEGIWVLNNEGSVEFRPEPNFYNNPTPINFTAQDVYGNNVAKDGLLSIKYGPIAKDNHKDNISLEAYSSGVTIDILANDRAADGSTLNPASVQLVAPSNGETSADGKMVTVTGEGVWIVDGEGKLTFTPEESFAANPTAITYTVKDNNGLVSNVATVTIAVARNITKSKTKITSIYWIDANGNDKPDPGEERVQGSPVELIDANGTVIAKGTTDKNGEYTFDNLVPGKYQVRFPSVPQELLEEEYGTGPTGNVIEVNATTGESNGHTALAGNDIEVNATTGEPDGYTALADIVCIGCQGANGVSNLGWISGAVMMILMSFVMYLFREEEA